MDTLLLACTPWFCTGRAWVEKVMDSSVETPSDTVIIDNLAYHFKINLLFY